MQGMAIGGALAGAYGAGGGLIVGFVAGLFTADSRHAQLTSQIQTEEAKDKLLQAQIEQELERQRQLEAQLLNPFANQTGQEQSGPPQRIRETDGATLTNIAMADRSNVGAPQSKKEPFANSASRPFKNVEVRDINADGIPDLWIYYDPNRPGEIVRQEEASRGDGRVDTWTYFKSGQMIRRDVDSKGLGRPDLVYYYDQEKLVREERDENGQGRMTYRANYENGRLAKVEKDTAGTGKADQWIYYDTRQQSEIVLKEERDLDGDGTVDLWGYYENGRLVRRDVSAVGMELLSKQELPPAFPPAHEQGLAPAAAPIGWSRR